MKNKNENDALTLILVLFLWPRRDWISNRFAHSKHRTSNCFRSYGFFIFLRLSKCIL